MSEPTEPEDAAVLAGAEVEHRATEPVASHQPRTEPASAEEKAALDAAIRSPQDG